MRVISSPTGSPSALPSQATNQPKGQGPLPMDAILQLLNALPALSASSLFPSGNGNILQGLTGGAPGAGAQARGGAVPQMPGMAGAGGVRQDLDPGVFQQQRAEVKPGESLQDFLKRAGQGGFAPLPGMSQAPRPLASLTQK